MVVVIDSSLPVVEVGRRNPLDLAVEAYPRCPAAFLDEEVMRLTRQHFLVDVALPSPCPRPLGVVNLASVSGLGAAGKCASPVECVQHNALAGAGASPGATEIE